MKKTIIFLLLLSCGLGAVSCSISANVSKLLTNPAVKTQDGGEEVKIHDGGEEKDNEILQKYSQILNVPVAKLQTPKLYEVIDQWLGTPYRYGGTTKNGIDCSGFVGVVYKTVTGRTIPRSTKGLFKAVSTTKNLVEGDLVFFNYDSKNSHVGIYLHNGKFVHASTSLGVTVSDLNTQHYKKTFSKGGPLKIGKLTKLTEMPAAGHTEYPAADKTIRLFIIQ